ncbi:GNAT family N-acetyltransferase [Plantactinospora sp. WMMB334]|uniref:GNAT family N-acetyltransferase n=1 Tax=Plantactinospora sp. WMMB334 TaxID=3404119 RepID=UPI003B94D36C
MAATAIRPYRPADHRAGRRLWAELTEQHRELYEDPGYGGADPGAAFEEYLTRLDLSGVWVAEREDAGVVGLIGLIMDGRVGRVEPVVVTARLRGQGIGRALLEQVAEEARGRGLARLTVMPQSRNVEALRCLRGAGYDVLSAVELSVELRPRPGTRQGPVELHGQRFHT